MDQTTMSGPLLGWFQIGNHVQGGASSGVAAVASNGKKLGIFGGRLRPSYPIFLQKNCTSVSALKVLARCTSSSACLSFSRAIRCPLSCALALRSFSALLERALVGERRCVRACGRGGCVQACRSDRCIGVCVRCARSWEAGGAAGARSTVLITNGSFVASAADELSAHAAQLHNSGQ
jgi:hypothetical protein